MMCWSRRRARVLITASLVAALTEPGPAKGEEPEVPPEETEGEQFVGQLRDTGDEDVDRPPRSLRTVFGHERDEQTPWWNQSWKPEDVVVAPPFAFANFMTGPWFGMRARLFDLGIDLRGDYVMESLGNPSGGIRQGFTYTHNLGLQLALYLEKLVGWPGATFRVKFSQRSGKSLSERKIGNNFSVQQIFGGQTHKLVNMHLMQSLFEDRINLSIGRIVYNDEFQHSPLNCQFLNNAFCGNPIAVFRNVPGGVTAYPTATWGARVRVRPSQHTYAMAAVYDGDPDQGDDNKHGTHLDFGDNGVFVAFEAGWVPSRGLLGLPAAYKIGAWYHSGKFDDLVEDINGDNALITGLPFRRRRGNAGYYATLDQMLYREGEGGQGLFLVASVMFGPDRDLNVLPFFYTAGLVYIGLLPGRPHDKAAVGAVTGFVRDRLRDAQRAAGDNVQDAETILEWNYHIQLTPFLYLRPDMQYVFKPNGLDEIDDAFVIGFEFGVRF
ncbi:MAG: carbohydrate porin [Myxococcota bacterium]|nr:carbohydrate porin [Myxococcota bacterium]